MGKHNIPHVNLAFGGRGGHNHKNLGEKKNSGTFLSEVEQNVKMAMAELRKGTIMIEIGDQVDGPTDSAAVSTLNLAMSNLKPNQSLLWFVRDNAPETRK